MTGRFEDLGPIRVLREVRSGFGPVVLVLAAGDLVASFGFSLIFPFLTIYLVQSLGATAAQAGLILAGYSLCSIVSGIGGGWLADRFGRRTVMLVSISLTSLTVILMGQARELGQIGALTVLLGIVDPAFVPAARAAIADTVAVERRPRAYSLLGVANAIGWIAGPSIGAGLASVGYPLLFTVAGVIIGLYTVIAWPLLPETRPDDPAVAAANRHAGEAVPSGQPVPESLAVDIVPATDPPPGSRAAFLVLLPMLVAIHAITFQWVSTLPIHAAVNLHVPTAQWGLLFSLNGVLIVLFQLRISTLVEGRSKPRLMAASISVYGAGTALVAILGGPLPTFLGLAVAIACFTLGEMLLFPIEPALVSDLSPADRRGLYQGLGIAAGGLGSALGPTLSGVVLDRVPGPALWVATAALAGAVALALLGLARRVDRLGQPGGLRMAAR